MLRGRSGGGGSRKRGRKEEEGKRKEREEWGGGGGRDGGCLADIAPTLIDLMGLKKPEEMTGNSLLIK